MKEILSQGSIVKPKGTLLRTSINQEPQRAHYLKIMASVKTKGDQFTVGLRLIGGEGHQMKKLRCRH